MEKLEGIQDGFGGPVFEGMDKDVVTIVVIQDHDILVAGCGWDHEATGLIGKDLARGFDGVEDGGKTYM